MSKPLSIYLIAGEASGDLLGAHLMRELKTQAANPVLFHGVGGEKMAEEGIESLFPYYELSMMGFIEVLPFIFNVAARVGATVDDILAKQPDVVVTIDSPGFCFWVAKKLRKEKFKGKLVHYVAPSVWAYKPKRAEKCAKLFDHLLCLLPFEPPYFEKVGLAATWVGHPVVAETKPGDGKAFREKYQITEQTMLFTLLPGSRKGEVERHMPIFARAVAMMAEQYPDMALAIPVPKNVMPFVAPFFENCPFRAIVTANEKDKKDALAAGNLGIVKSGTVALEAAMAGIPMVVTYRVNALSAWWFRRIRLTKYANLINIIQQKEIIPELLQELCAPLFIASASSQLLSRPESWQRQKEQIQAALARLTTAPGALPSKQAAAIVLGMI